jgi:hypothetical protein
LIEEPKADPSSVRGFFGRLAQIENRVLLGNRKNARTKKQKDGSPYGHLSPSLITTDSCFFINYYKRVTFFDVLLGP